MIRKLLPCILFSLIAGWAFNLISYTIRTTWPATHDIHLTNTAIMDRLSHPLFFSLHKNDLISSIAGIIITILIYIYHTTMEGNTRIGEEHGSAAWATPADMKPFTDPDTHYNLQFTHTEKLSLNTQHTHRNLNALIMGASGSGKTRGYVIPNMLSLSTSSKPVSFAVTDPKGELYKHTAAYMKKAGYTIKQLNLIDMASSSRFNPLAYINPTDPEGAIMRLTENIITNTGGKNDKNDFWDKASKSLLNALIAWVYFFEDNENITLNTVTTMISRMQASEENENAMSSIDNLFAEAREWIHDYHNDPESYDNNAAHTLDGLAFASSQYRAYEQGAGETKKSIITTLANLTTGLQTSRIKNLLNTDDMELDNISKKKTIIYIMISDTEKTFNFLAAIFYQCLFENSIYHADHTATGTLTQPLHVFLDEFANIGKIPGFSTLIATMRSRNISCSIILQTLAQIKSMYKDDWETILANCDSKLFLGGNDQTTTEYFSKTLGNQTIDTITTSETKGINGSWSIQHSKQKRELLTPDELGRLKNTDCIYILRGIKPFHSTKIN